jgi:hypothetical protein
MSDIIYKSINRRSDSPYAKRPTADGTALLEKWAPAIFDAWRPYHNETEGGVLLMRPIDDGVARCAWIPHAIFLQKLAELGMPNQPPCNRPAHEMSPASTGKPGDIMWVIMQTPEDRVMVWSIEWSFPLPGPVVAGGDA